MTIAELSAVSRRCASGRLESFFGPAKVVSSTVGKRPAAAPAAGKGPAAKKGKAGGVGGKAGAGSKAGAKKK